MQEQLGLKLESIRGSMEVLVVDRVERLDAADPFEGTRESSELSEIWRSALPGCASAPSARCRDSTGRFELFPQPFTRPPDRDASGSGGWFFQRARDLFVIPLAIQPCADERAVYSAKSFKRCPELSGRFASEQLRMRRRARIGNGVEGLLTYGAAVRPAQRVDQTVLERPSKIGL